MNIILFKSLCSTFSSVSFSLFFSCFQHCLCTSASEEVCHQHFDSGVCFHTFSANSSYEYTRAMITNWSILEARTFSLFRWVRCVHTHPLGWFIQNIWSIDSLFQIPFFGLVYLSSDGDLILHKAFTAATSALHICMERACCNLQSWHSVHTVASQIGRMQLCCFVHLIIRYFQYP